MHNLYIIECNLLNIQRLRSIRLFGRWPISPGITQSLYSFDHKVSKGEIEETELFVFRLIVPFFVPFNASVPLLTQFPFDKYFFIALERSFSHFLTQFRALLAVRRCIRQFHGRYWV